MKLMSSNEVVAENLRFLRQQRGWSQELCAEKCELHRTYIGAVERGERNITLGTLDRIAQALGTTALGLMTPRAKR
jgi:transcriptional regulator with XRE-family HTH domain